MKKHQLVALLVALLVVSLLFLTGQAQAGDNGCFSIDAKANGTDLGFDPPGGSDGVTVARVKGGGVLEGQWVEIYHVTGVVGNDASFTSMMIFSNESGLLKVPVAGVLNVTTGHFSMTGNVTQGTGRYAGATGTLTFTGDENFTTMKYVETINGTICLKRN